MRKSCQALNSDELYNTLKEIRRVCKGYFIIREHDCRNSLEKMLIDVEHSLYEVTIEKEPNMNFLDTYEAYYRNIKEWDDLLYSYNFRKIYQDPHVKGPTRYYYAVYQPF